MLVLGSNVERAAKWIWMQVWFGGVYVYSCECRYGSMETRLYICLEVNRSAQAPYCTQMFATQRYSLHPPHFSQLFVLPVGASLNMCSSLKRVWLSSAAGCITHSLHTSFSHCFSVCFDLDQIVAMFSHHSVCRVAIPPNDDAVWCAAVDLTPHEAFLLCSSCLFVKFQMSIW